MKKLLNTFKLASAVLFALVLSMLISTDALAASYPIGSLKYPIGTNTSNYTSSYNAYPFTYKSYSDKNNNTKKILLLQSRVLATGTAAQNYVLNYDKYAKTAGVGQQWMVFEFKLTYDSNSTSTESITVPSFISSATLCNKAGSEITAYDKEYMNFFKADYNVYSYNLTPGYYATFKYAVLIDTAVGYPLFKMYNYAGNLTKNEMYISVDPARVNKKDICMSTSSVGSANYTGKAVTPSYKLVDNFNKTGTLKKGTHYTVKVSKNIRPGVGIIQFIGIGEYEGILERYFYVKPKTNSIKVSNLDYDCAKLTWTSQPEATGYYIYKYNTSTKKYTYVTTRQTNSMYIFDLAPAYGYKYAVYPYVKVSDPYSTSYKSIEIKGVGKTISFTTRPKRCTITKFTKPSRTSLKGVWSKSTRASGYRVVVAYDRNLKQIVKQAYVSSKTTTKTFTGLKRGKWYYYAVIPYKTVGKTKLYSSTYYYYYAKLN